VDKRDFFVLRQSKKIPISLRITKRQTPHFHILFSCNELNDLLLSPVDFYAFYNIKYLRDFMKKFLFLLVVLLKLSGSSQEFVPITDYNSGNYGWSIRAIAEMDKWGTVQSRLAAGYFDYVNTTSMNSSIQYSSNYLNTRRDRIWRGKLSLNKENSAKSWGGPVKAIKFTLVKHGNNKNLSKGVLVIHEGSDPSGYPLNDWKEIGRYSSTKEITISDLPEGPFQIGLLLSHDYDYNQPSLSSNEISGQFSVNVDTVYIAFDTCDCGCEEDEGVSHTDLDENGSPLKKLSTSTSSVNLNLPRNLGSENISSPKFINIISRASKIEELLRKNSLYHQVKNDKGLTQIDVIDEDSYTIKQYNISKVGPVDVDGYYTVTDSADTEMTFSKDPATPHILNIEEKKGGNIISNTSYSYDEASDYWMMGQDADGDGNMDRYEYTEVTTDNGNTVKTHYIYDGSMVLASKTQSTYDANNNLIEEIVDPDGKALTTSYQYDANNNLTRVDNFDGSWETTTYTANDEPELITRSSGLFTKYEYDGSDRVIKTIESFNGSAYSATDSEHRVTTYSYTPEVTGDDGSVDGDQARTITESILGNPINVTYYGYLAGESITIRGATPTSSVNDANNLVSRSLFYTSGDFVDETYKEINEDGTGSIITYDQDGDTLTVTTDSGVLSGDLLSIINGTSTVVMTTNDLEVSTITFDIASGILISSRTVVSRDGRDRESVVEYHDETTETFGYNCCNLDTTTSRDGIATSYTFDGLGRELTSTTNGVTRTNSYDAAGNLVAVVETGTDSSTRTLSQSYYNLAGQLEWTKDAIAYKTTYASTYSAGTTTQTVTFPNTKTSITTSDSEGRVLSVSGTGVFPQAADLNNEFVELDANLGYHVQVQQYGQSDNWSKTYTDALGRSYKSLTSTGATSTQTYDISGDLVQSTSASGAITLYYNDPAQGLFIQALDVNQNGSIDYGTDVITRSESTYLTENSIDWQRTESWINPDSFATPGTADNVRKVNTTGLLMVNTSTANGISSTLKVITEIDPDGKITTTSVAPDGSYTKTEVIDGLQNSLKSYDVGDVLKSTIDYAYDQYNRLETQTDSRNGTTTYAYDDNDRVLTLTTSDPDGTGPKEAQVFETVYDNMGRREKVIHPDASQISFLYTDQGLIENSSGSQVYPRTYSYDNKGNLTGLTTNGQAGSSTLSWGYYDNGQLQTKTDAKNRQVSYTYYASGQVESKTNARNITKTWNYDNSGRLDGITYSDDTPSISFGYNEIGRLSTVSDSLGDRNLNYNALGQYTGNSWLSGVLSGLEQSYTYDFNGRQETAGFSIGGVTRTNNYLYNSFGLLEEVNDGKNQYKYSYLEQSPYTVEALEVEKDGTVQMHSKREFDKLMRTTGFSWATGAKE
jgi:YD repeat-containing protein